MCLIIHKPANLVFHDSWLRDFYTRNRDGYGFMHSEGGKLYIHKSLGDVERFIAAFKRRMDKEVVVHLRMRTHGDIDLDNCHPYQVLAPSEGGPLGTVWMVHNGVLSHGNTANTTKSDTWHYINNVLVPLLRRDPLLLLEPAFQKLVRGDIGGGNKFVFMASRGDIVFVNREAGVEHQGAWMSNTYAWNPPTRSTHYNDNSGYHYSGYHSAHGARGSNGRFAVDQNPIKTIKMDVHGFFNLLKEKKHDDAWRDLQHADFHSASELSPEGTNELLDHINHGSFIPGTDDKFIVSWMQQLGRKVVPEAQREAAEKEMAELAAKREALTKEAAAKKEVEAAQTAQATLLPAAEVSMTGASGGASSESSATPDGATVNGTIILLKGTTDETSSDVAVSVAATPATSSETIAN